MIVLTIFVVIIQVQISIRFSKIKIKILDPLNDIDKQLNIDEQMEKYFIKWRFKSGMFDYWKDVTGDSLSSPLHICFHQHPSSSSFSAFFRSTPSLSVESIDTNEMVGIAGVCCTCHRSSLVALSLNSSIQSTLMDVYFIYPSFFPRLPTCRSTFFHI